MEVKKRTKIHSIKKISEFGETTMPAFRGVKGDTGLTGPMGPAGPQGERGVPGKDGVNGKDGRDGIDGKDGKDGRDGKDGVTTTVTKEIAIDLTDVKTSVSEISARVEKLEKAGNAKVANSGYFPGGKHSPDVIYATGDASVGINDAVVICSASGTIRLPPSPKEDQNVTVKQGSASVVVTIDGRGKYIDGATTYVIAAAPGETAYTGVHMMFVRGQWYLV